MIDRGDYELVRPLLEIPLLILKLQYEYIIDIFIYYIMY